MSKAYEFIKECECFYVATMNGDFPAVRPFGVIMEVGDDLYIATHDGNEAHKQLRKNGNVQIVAKKTGLHEWIRITGIAEESNDLQLKQRFMEEAPFLAKHYGSADSPHFLMFKIKVQSTEIKAG